MLQNQGFPYPKSQLLHIKNMHLRSSFPPEAQRGHSQYHSWREYMSGAHQMSEPGTRGPQKVTGYLIAPSSACIRGHRGAVSLYRVPTGTNKVPSSFDLTQLSSAQLETHGECRLPDLATQ